MQRDGWVKRLGVAGWALAIGAGLILRFVQRSDLWLDEALSVNIASLPIGDIPEALRHDGHPPLYYVLLHGWMEVFGTSNLAVRSLSAVFSLAAVVAIAVIAGRLGGRRMAQAAVLLFLGCPFVVRYATEARMYSLIILLVLLGWLALDAALRSPTIGRLALVALVSGTLVLTHYWAIWLLLATEIGLAVLLWRGDRSAPDRPAPPARSLVRALVALPAGAVLVLPWLPSMLEQLSHTGTPWAPPSRPSSVFALTFKDIAGERSSEAILFSIALATLLPVGLYWHRRATSASDADPGDTESDVLELDFRHTGFMRWEAFVAAGALAMGGIVALVSATAFASRYSSVAVPLMLLVAAAGLASLPSRARVVSIITVTALGIILSTASAVSFPRTQAGDVAEAARADGLAAGDVVVYCPDQLGPSVGRLLPDDVVGLPYPALGDPDLVDWRNYGDRNAAADPEAIAAEVLERAGDHRVYVASFNQYRTFEGQCEALLGSLSQSRHFRLLVSADNDFYEPIDLVVFDPS
jgi:mannosyltransferase